MATPADIAGAMRAPMSQREREMNTAMDLGLEYVPGQAAGTAARTATEKAQRSALEKSNSQIMSGYQPILDFYANQQQQTNARYATNAANLKSIFGALSGISAKDTANINSQFASSITKQQADLATRTAEQRAAQAAGAAQAAITGAERGNGPALVGSPTATATNQAIGQSNAIQQNWEGLMGAQQMNALTDVANRGAGYGQQEVAATNQMTQNLQEELASIGGQVAGIQGQIAQAKVARDQAIQSGEYEAAAAAQKTLDDLKLQELKNEGSLNVAKTAAAARVAARSTGGGTSTKPKTYAKGTTGTLQRIADTYGAADAADYQAQWDKVQAARPKDATAAFNLWIRYNPAINALDPAVKLDIKSAAKDFFNSLTYPKGGTSGGVQNTN